MAIPQPPIQRVRLFRNGADQAVCIPFEFELPGNEALIRREGRVLVVEPVPTTQQSLAELFATWGPLDSDFPNADQGLLPLDGEVKGFSHFVEPERQDKREGWQSLFDEIDRVDWSGLPSLEKIRASETTETPRETCASSGACPACASKTGTTE